MPLFYGFKKEIINATVHIGPNEDGMSAMATKGQEDAENVQEQIDVDDGSDMAVSF